MNKPMHGWKKSKTLTKIAAKDGRIKAYRCESDNSHYIELLPGFYTDEGCIEFREDRVCDMVHKIKHEIHQVATWK